jgi:hypothetical protein
MVYDSDFNIQSFNIDPILLVDELSSTEFYVGRSINSNDTSKANWRIERIQKIGSTWKFEFPDGNQSYDFIWDNRFTYSYNN